MKPPILPDAKFSNPDVMELYEQLRCLRFAIVNNRKRDSHIFMDGVMCYLYVLDNRLSKTGKEQQ